MFKSQKIGSLAIGTAIALAIALCTPVHAEDANGDALDTVTVQLDYLVRGNHGMFFVAKEKGYFKEQGIRIEDIRRGNGSPNTLRLVGTGGAEFGFADLPSLVIARAQTVPVKALVAVNQKSPLALCSLSEHVKLKSVSDLEGLTMGVHLAGSTFIFYNAITAINDIDRGKVKEVTVKPPYHNYLLQGVVDAIVCYTDAEVPVLRRAAGGKGSLSILYGSDAGYSAYGSGLFTSDEMIEEHPDLVQRFVNAYMKAFEYVIDHPKETAKIIAQSSPELEDKVDLFTGQLQIDIDHTFTSTTTKEKGLGSMSEEKWKSTIDILANQGVLDSVPAVDDVYAPQFVRHYHESDA